MRTKKQLVEKQAEISGASKNYKVRLVSYYHNAEPECTDWRGKFSSYAEAHDFAIWWKKQK